MESTDDSKLSSRTLDMTDIMISSFAYFALASMQAR